MKTRRIIYSIFLFLVLLLELVVNTKISLLLLLTSIFLPLISVLFCLLNRGKVVASLQMPEELERGEDARITVLFHNAGKLPVANVMARVTLTNALTGSEVEEEVHCSVSGKGTGKATLKLEKAEVGQVYLTVSETAVTDFFRLVGFSVEGATKKSILVYPQSLNVTVNQVDTLELTGDSDTYSETTPGQDVSETFDVREYLPGDNIRSIHWKLSSKLDNEVVRTFGQQLNYSVVVLVELASDKPAFLEANVTYAANLSEKFLLEGVPHTLAWYDRGLQEYCSYNIAREEEYEAALTRLVCSTSNKDPHLALRSYLAQEDRNDDALLYYITNSAADELVLRTAIMYRTELFLVGKKPKGELAQMLSITSLPGVLK